MRQDPSIIFFDGVCQLCNTFVDWTISRDSRKSFLFASLQGETARARLSQDQIENMQSLILLQNRKAFQKSDAVIEVLRQLPGWGWTPLFKVFPRNLRDLVYDYVAKNRYSWFGRREVCRLPLPSERDRLLP